MDEHDLFYYVRLGDKIHHVAKDECGVQGVIMGGTMWEERGDRFKNALK